ncbi:D-amino acid dehydrogenase [Paraburkholderia sp. BL21I4N1]|uniref:D-amino acid dehydrogenase n=1 Tax=Paraburkholderia sp. BL21I4N1 TaxID=1938801 RepID=UPI000CFB9CF6|nr:D-amino acid dehydrogenase [Paraburkholderia sp. BL21I4N1]PQV47499.1 D-amino acid dehydrogenase small subunit [Paraburkholderia sp. BL21I4N1]
MHVCVFGGGVVGVTTAYYLAREGWRVTLVERHSQPGLETSFANGGQLSYSYVAPLAGPSVPGNLAQWLLSRTAPLRFQPSLSLAQWGWCAAFLFNCTTARNQRTTIELLQLGAYSRDVMHDLMQTERLDFAFRPSGKLVVYRDRDAFDRARRQMEFQARFGAQHTALDAASCIDTEPALDSLRHTLAGGIYTASEETGDCHLFTRELARVAIEKYGVRFVGGTAVTGLRREGNKIVAAYTSQGEIAADAYVVALGNHSAALVRPLGIRLPIYPLKGYSLTMPVGERHVAPRVSVTDLHHKVVYARLGQHLRVAGMVDMTPAGSREDQARIRLLTAQAQATMPNAGDFSSVRAWTGFRPATPDSKPLLGATPLANLWLNTGQGSLGFTLAGASAALLTDAIHGRAGKLDLRPYQLTNRDAVRKLPTMAHSSPS